MRYGGRGIGSALTEDSTGRRSPTQSGVRHVEAFGGRRGPALGHSRRTSSHASGAHWRAHCVFHTGIRLVPDRRTIRLRRFTRQSASLVGLDYANTPPSRVPAAISPSPLLEDYFGAQSGGSSLAESEPRHFGRTAPSGRILPGVRSALLHLVGRSPPGAVVDELWNDPEWFVRKVSSVRFVAQSRGVKASPLSESLRAEPAPPEYPPVGASPRCNLTGP